MTVVPVVVHELFRVFAICVVLAHQPCDITLGGSAAPPPGTTVFCTYLRDPVYGEVAPGENDAVNGPLEWSAGECKVRDNHVTMPWTPPGTFKITIDVAKYE